MNSAYCLWTIVLNFLFSLSYYVQCCTAPDDYLPLNLLLLFTPGIQHVTIRIHAIEDLLVESELEWLTLALDTLFVPAGRVVFTRPNATVFIEDTNSESSKKIIFNIFLVMCVKFNDCVI